MQRCLSISHLSLQTISWCPDVIPSLCLTPKQRPPRPSLDLGFSQCALSLFALYLLALWIFCKVSWNKLHINSTKMYQGQWFTLSTWHSLEHWKTLNEKLLRSSWAVGMCGSGVRYTFWLSYLLWEDTAVSGQYLSWGLQSWTVYK